MKSIEEIISEYNSLGINQQIDYDKFYLYSIITHSTAIEGSTITEVENQLLFDEGLGSNKPIKEQMMNLDLKKAYEKSFEFAKNHENITVEMLCMLSGILMQNTGSEFKTIAGNFSAAKGELRLVNVSAGRGGKSYMAWQKVPVKLQEFCDWLNEERKGLDDMSLQDKYELSFEAHYKLVSIHPWADGNGRMARLVMNMIQYEANIIPSVVKKENRVEYIKSLSDSQDNEDSTVFIDFMMKHHMNNLLKQIEEYKKSTQSETIHQKKDNSSDWSR
ncbi:MAG: Fic family protein [Treponema sp.]|nr:Fic family protein [Treponema sp.]